MKYWVCELSDLEERERYFVSVEGLTVGITMVNGRIYAIENKCPHFKAPFVSEKSRSVCGCD